ncbi:MAG: methyl-accepting chemotaxis protein [Kamptonema sp. SIO4C4]|nr:methyl-accepting chemotaxis protein [Kamptonema sp. SIO4C4]
MFFRQWNLQTRLLSSFILMGVIVLIVALVGWGANHRLNRNFQNIANNSFPSTIALWQINEGQTQIESIDRLLLNPSLTEEERQLGLERLEAAWEQINEGFSAYENSNTVRGDAEAEQYRLFLQDWEAWKNTHDEFIVLEERYRDLGIQNPWQRKLVLMQEEAENPTEVAQIEEALRLRSQIDNLRDTRLPLLQKTETSIAKLLQLNQQNTEAIRNAAEANIANSNFWVVVGLIIGPLTAILLGFSIGRNIIRSLSEIINIIASSSTQIATSVEEQERVADEQAISVNQTTATMDELRTSARQSAKQAEAGLENAHQVLNLAEEGSDGAHQVLNLANDGSQVVENTLTGIKHLEKRVQEISDRITQLSDRTSQISNITKLVGDIANQTNMLALNAAVEAVRAGEHGKGFSVVATEIRKLADQSKQSAEQINQIIVDIQNAILTTVSVADDAKKEANNSITLSQQTTESFQGVRQAIDNIVLKNQETTLNAVNEIVVSNKQISLTAQQQAVAVEQVVSAMNEINNGAQQTANGINQTRQGIQKMNEAAQTLKGMTGS